MAILTPTCGHHCVAQKAGDGPSAHVMVRHCPCPECHAELSSSVITGPGTAPGGISMVVGWGDQGPAQAIAIQEEGKADQAALDGTKGEMVDEAVEHLNRDLDDPDW